MMKLNDNGNIIPDFLNNNVFKESLEEGLGENVIEVIDSKIVVASKPGENYTSIIYGCTVIYRKANNKVPKTANLIVKSIIIDDIIEEKMAERTKIIDKEIDVYLELLPKLNATLGNFQFSPKCYHIFMKPSRNFVFEDMRASGYKIADREVGLDEAHLRVTLEKLGKFHAASMEVLRKEPHIEDKFKNGFFTKESVKEQTFKRVFAENFKHGAELVRNMPGYEHFSAKLMKVYEHFEEIALEGVAFDASKDLKILNHGDLWVNNFLFKYNEETNKPIDIVYVDYQGTFFNSPGIDINYLFATSATLENMKRKSELVEKYYYPSFEKTLKSLKFAKIPTLNDILEEIHKREIYTLICLFGVLPLISMDREESKTNGFEQFLDKEKSDKKRAVGMSSQRFRESMKFTLKQIESVIDEMISKY